MTPLGDFTPLLGFMSVFQTGIPSQRASQRAERHAPPMALSSWFPDRGGSSQGKMLALCPVFYQLSVWGRHSGSPLWQALHGRGAGGAPAHLGAWSPWCHLFPGPDSVGKADEAAPDSGGDQGGVSESGHAFIYCFHRLICSVDLASC